MNGQGPSLQRGGIQITVLMATRDREAVLPRVLDGYRRLDAPAFAWKLVIVDNGSSDATPQILRSYSSHLPLQVLGVGGAGKNRALNVGIHAFEGSLLVLTDDDAIPEPSFLAAWGRFLGARADHALLGGSIKPIFDVPLPRWLKERGEYMAMMFGERTLPDGPVAPDQIYGANMAVRAALIQDGLRFDERLGPDATNRHYLTGGETDFCQRAANAGARCWFASDPCVHHIVRQSDMTGGAYARRAYRLGCARAIEAWRLKTGGRGPHGAGAPARSGLRLWVQYRLAMLLAKPSRRFEGGVAYQVERGFREQWIRQERQFLEASTAREPASTEVDRSGSRRHEPRSSKPQHGSSAGERRQARLRIPF